MYIEKLASAIKNDLLSGLRGYHHNLSINMDLLADEIVDTRLYIIESEFRRGNIPLQDLLVAINCIDVDCESLDRCKCKDSVDDTLVAHFEIPQVMYNLGPLAINYIGSTDRMNKFRIVTSLPEVENYRYRRRGKKKPYVYIDFAPNGRGMLDCFLFNAPLVQQVSVVGIFKDPRQIETYSCCQLDEDGLTGPDDNHSYITKMIKEQITKEKLYYYRQLAAPLRPNDQTYTTAD